MKVYGTAGHCASGPPTESTTCTSSSHSGTDSSTPTELDLATAERELRVPKCRWARSVPAVAAPPFRYWEMAGGRPKWHATRGAI
jgi:hypothetical protein